MASAQWADEHGYRHIRCNCGWSGWTDSGCENCDNQDSDCEDCGCDECECQVCYACRNKTESKYGDVCECAQGPTICTLHQVKRHVARKAHGTTIRSGDTYEAIVTGGYVQGGGRWLTTRKRLIKRAVVA